MSMHADEESDEGIVPMKRSNNEGVSSAETGEGRTSPEGNGGEPAAAGTLRRDTASNGLIAVRRSARQSKSVGFTALLHHITTDLLKQSYLSLERDSAPGIDGVTWQAYGENLEEKPKELHDKVHRGSYRAHGGRARIGLDEVARIAYFRPDTLSPGFQAELVATRHYVPKAWPFAFTNGVQASHVEVDIETCRVTLLKHWCVEDCGTVINRSLSRNRFAAGWCKASRRRCLRIANMTRAGNAQWQHGRYLVPLAAEMPDIGVGHLVSPTADSELGAKRRRGRHRGRDRRGGQCRQRRVERARSAQYYASADHAGEGVEGAGKGVGVARSLPHSLAPQALANTSRRHSAGEVFPLLPDFAAASFVAALPSVSAARPAASAASLAWRSALSRAVFSRWAIRPAW
jgi:hypothetical protein